MVTFQVAGQKYLALLKMNYKESFVHMTNAEEAGNVNSIIRYQATLPGSGSKLSEAVIINLPGFLCPHCGKEIRSEWGKSKLFIRTVSAV